MHPVDAGEVAMDAAVLPIQLAWPVAHPRGLALSVDALVLARRVVERRERAARPPSAASDEALAPWSIALIAGMASAPSCGRTSREAVERGARVAGELPADHAPRVDVDHERQEHQSLPAAQVGQVSDIELVWP
jgi:hypothetical protein